MALLVVENLKVHYVTRSGPARAVDGVTFSVAAGEAFGLVGESGCGKTTLARALIRVLPPQCRIAGGQIRFQGEDIAAMSEAALRRVRWTGIAMVSQHAQNGLDPVYRVGTQIIEAVRAHTRSSTAAARKRAEECFRLVGLDPERLAHFPHQFSGGMRQRAMIAMALVLDPALIIADEPTTGLDVIVQDQIFAKLADIRQKLGKAMFLVTHDMALVAENCNRVGVMYAGQIVEQGPTHLVFGRPAHPYTMGLKNAFPSLKNVPTELTSIRGSPPSLIDPPAGCRFHPRCPFAVEVCRREAPPVVSVGVDHLVACHRHEEAGTLRETAKRATAWEKAVPAARGGAASD